MYIICDNTMVYDKDYGLKSDKYEEEKDFCGERY